MTDVGSMSIEEALTHFGVKGMKWGVRKGKSETGISRFNAAKIQSNDRLIRANQKALEKRAKSRVARIIYSSDKKIGKNVAKLEASNERIRAGERKIQDILNVHSTVGYTDLFFTKTPKNA